MNTLYIILLILLVLIGGVFILYNKLVTLRMRVKEARADIDVQLKKRYDLLPDLVETARRAVKLDEDLLTKVTELRSRAMEESVKDSNLKQRAEIENQLSSLVRDVKVQVEAYPDIKSHAELTDLMNKTTDIEEKIAYSRRYYNSSVLDYNTKISHVPMNLIAKAFKFNSEEFFAASEEEKQDVKVKFE